ncbi:MAG: ATP-binding cassette domain-containing protein [bacterium]
MDINMVIRTSQIVGIVGPNGAGKSTLVYLLAGLLRPSAGTFLIDGKSLYTSKGVFRSALAALRKSVALVSQFPEDQFFTESVYDELSFGLKKQGVDEGEIGQRVMSTLHELGLKLSRESIMHRSPFEFGGGEKRLISIACALVSGPEILILDEPTAGLDTMAGHMVFEAIRRLHQQLGVSIVLVSHELERLIRLADHLIILHRGRIVQQGSPQGIFSKPEDILGLGLQLPQITALGYELEKNGIKLDPWPLFDIQEAAALIREWLKSEGI